MQRLPVSMAAIAAARRQASARLMSFEFAAGVQLEVRLTARRNALDKWTGVR